MFPFFPFNFYARYPHYTYYNKNTNYSPNLCNKSSNISFKDFSKDLPDSDFMITDSTNNSNNITKNSKNAQKRSYKYNNNFAHINLDYLFNSDLEHPIVEFMGFKLYLDDLIILGLLFFLYKEDVHDEILFVILLLLLLSWRAIT